MVRPSTLVALALTLFALPAAATEPPPDRTESPYFRVIGETNTETLPLVSTRADVDIAGVIARVNVKQTYKNSGSSPIEAIYVFPGSTRAAVFKMKMTIGDRTIEAKIQEKDAARKLYEKAKQEGKSASLLEQQRPNVFTMNVANIMPGDVIEVDMTYSELLVPTEGVYEFVYPTVVGPRYDGPQGATPTKSEAWTANPFLSSNEPTYTFGLSANIAAGMPISAVTSPSHRIAPQFSGATRASVRVDDEDGGNRDFVLKYRLAGEGIQSGLLMYPGASEARREAKPTEDGTGPALPDRGPEAENFFLMMMQPPKRLNPSMVPPREYIFILDVSGSMGGFPLDTAKTVIEELLAGLKREDRFNIMFFSGGSQVLNEESVPASDAWKRRAADMLARQRGGGGTQILPAMQRALAMPRAANMSTSMVVVTDGYVSVEKKTFDLIAENLGEANLFAFGIGRSVNRHLIEGMAAVGRGTPFVVLGPQDAPAAAKRFKTYIESPVLTDVKISFDGFDAYDVEPKSIPDVFAQRPVVVFGKYRGTPSGHIALAGYNGQGRWSQSLAVKATDASADHEALRQLWARHKIARLDDLATLGRTNVKDEVTKLGLEYSLMTKYTSFLAVDSLVRNHSGVSNTVAQPLPTPSGVAPAAPVGSASGGAAYYKRARRLSRPRPAPSRSYAPAPAAEPAEAEEADGLGDASSAIVSKELERTESKPRTAMSRRVIRDRLAKCVEGGTKQGAKARVVLVISPSGQLVDVRFSLAPLTPTQEQCIRRAAKTLALPRGRSVQMPILLRF